MTEILITARDILFIVVLGVVCLLGGRYYGQVEIYTMFMSPERSEVVTHNGVDALPMLPLEGVE